MKLLVAGTSSALVLGYSLYKNYKLRQELKNTRDILRGYVSSTPSVKINTTEEELKNVDNVRVYKEGDMITQDFNQKRINIEWKYSEKNDIALNKIYLG
tara:strand:+ start:135 stop:431 length:297 start_codon:yes stop_codon:yes gene_type:complete